MEIEKIKELKSALDYCSNHNVLDCSNVCPYDKYNSGCRTELAKACLTLINELESDNESQKKAISDYLDVIMSCTKREKDYKGKNHDLHIENVALRDRIDTLEKENANKTDIITDLLNKQEFYEAEKLKRFAEKLKEKVHKRDYVQGYAEIGLCEEIDETLKETLEENN